MTRFVVLDAGPLGLACRAPGIPIADQCRQWLKDLGSASVLIVAPEIADYEVRRELIRLHATAGLRRLDRLGLGFVYDPITTPSMRLAAEFWAHVRRFGMPTADPQSLDPDCILAAQASLLGSPTDDVVIATTNVGHLRRFPRVTAEPWDKILP
ncbi:type II toxin-antitoxin system VapC family toxin [Aquisphaera insulae]|uniref:type II toxin-antitoxin system VapC family toxin n=1 Tax=Aquisphaera insulae TaxID=2712864 RepID=UPI0013EACBAC|nr:type II toxin-antitoxin system VapC family toxin [Aquisphaera insulae]